jgi:two-component sensor histidine kinase/PAS domain-containing protein
VTQASAERRVGPTGQSPKQQAGPGGGGLGDTRGDTRGSTPSSAPPSALRGTPGGHAAGLTRRGSRLVQLLPVMALLLPLVMLGGGGWAMWRLAWEEAVEELLRSAQGTAEYGARALTGYAVGAGRINERLRGLSDAQITEAGEALRSELRGLVEEMPTTSVAYVVGREGTPLLATNLARLPAGVSLADRDYFQALVAEDAPRLFLSRQFVGRFDGNLLFTVARRREGTGNVPPGQDGFDGLIAVSVDPNLLGEGMRRLQAPTDSLALVRNDGYVLSRSVGQTEPLPPVSSESPFHQIASGRRESHVYQSTRTLDGEPALFAAYPINGFDVQAVALRPRREIVARWQRSMVGYLVFGLPATAALLWLALRVRADQLRLAAANAALGRELERDADRLDRAARVGLVGTFEVDLATGVSLRSAEYMALQGQPARPMVETHADWVRRLHPDDRARAEGYLIEALSDASTITEYAQSYRILTPAGEVRWIASRGEIQRDAKGRAVFMRGAHVDVTPLRETQMALAESDARLRLAQEAVGIGTWEWFPATRSLNWSSKMIELWGFDPAAGQPDLQEAVSRLHPLDRARVRREMATAHRSGWLRSEFRINRPVAGEAGPPGQETIWIIVRARLVPSEGGPGARLIGVAYDVTERKQAEAHSQMLAHEVEHRAKNALAVVAGLLRVTTADSHEEYVEVLEARVQALAGTMALLGRHRWKGASVGELLQHELEPFGMGEGAGASPVTLEGPKVMVGPEVAQPLSMALHELATNAAKYGALSSAAGRLHVSWTIRGRAVEMRWRETGGPPLDGPPARTSFGSQIITHSFQGTLGGTIVRHWNPDGLACDIHFPLDL